MEVRLWEWLLLIGLLLVKPLLVLILHEWLLLTMYKWLLLIRFISRSYMRGRGGGGEEEGVR